MVKVVSLKTVRGKVIVELDNGRRYHLKPADLVGFPLSEMMKSMKRFLNGKYCCPSIRRR